MAIRHRTFSFSSVDISGIVAEMESFAAHADGRRWLNIVPDADESEIHTGTGMWRVFSSRGPVIPQLTWVPAHESRGRQQPDQVGLAHATGKDAVARLEAHGVIVPSGWHVTQDHQKRGVIFDVEPGVPVRTIVEFAMPALRALSPFQFEDAYLATFSQQ